MNDAELWEELRREAGVKSDPDCLGAPQPQRPKRNPKALKVQRHWSEPLQGPRLPFPWETPEFDPSSEAVQNLTRNGKSLLAGFRLGSAPIQVGKERWVSVQNYIPWWSAPTWLAYPLPTSYGKDPLEATEAFLREWEREFRRIAGLPTRPGGIDVWPREPGREPRDQELPCET